MYCPRCANKFESGTAYCRTCGLSLDQVSAIVSGEKESQPVVKSVPNRDLMRYGIGTFVLGLVIALGNAALRDFHLYPDSIGKFVFLTLIMLGMAMLGAGMVFPQKRYIKTDRGSRNEVDGQNALPTANLGSLPSADRSIDEIVFPANTREPDSVTEPTTRHLR
jgi:hypothetical protein